MARVIRLGEDRELGHGERQIARERALEAVANGVRIERFSLHHVGKRLREERVALGLQRLEGEHHVVGGERASVVELRLRPEREGDGQAVAERPPALFATSP